MISTSSTGDEGVCAALNEVTSPSARFPARRPAAVVKLPRLLLQTWSAIDDEPAVQRGVREVGPGPGGHLSVRGESQKQPSKVLHSAISCHKRKEPKEKR